MDLTKNVGYFISRTVIDNDKFNSHAGFAEDFIHQITDGLSSVVSRDNDANVDLILHHE